MLNRLLKIFFVIDDHKSLTFVKDDSKIYLLDFILAFFATDKILSLIIYLTLTNLKLSMLNAAKD